MRQRRSKTKNMRKISYYKTVILTLKNHKKLNLKFKIKKNENKSFYLYRYNWSNYTIFCD